MSRPGAISINLDIEHPDLYELLNNMAHKKYTAKSIHSLVTVGIGSKFWELLNEGDIAANKLFGKLLETQMTTGSPCLFFKDNVRESRPFDYKSRNLNVATTNICTEILRYHDSENTGVCTLSSLNAAAYFEWIDWEYKGWNLPKVITYLLEGVIDDYIKKASKIPYLEKAVNSVKKERAIGIGILGLHTLYQSKGLPFNHPSCFALNQEIFANIYQKSDVASKELAGMRGYPEWSTLRRHLALTAIAPTKTNSKILGVSEGINPIDNNVSPEKQSQGDFDYRNPLLIELLESKGQNNSDVWRSISDNLGSVMHLDFLSFAEKMVFLTAREIPQRAMLDQARDRLPYVDQSQSLNRWVSPFTDAKVVAAQVMYAHDIGLKTLYYTRSSNRKKLTKVVNKAYIVTKENCPYCIYAKDLLKNNEIEFVEFKESEIDLEYFNYPSFPQIWWAGHHVGGYHQLEMCLSNEGFDQDKELEDCDSCSA